MAHSANADKDIFISYCHDDNENPLGEGWIEQFHDTLRTRLKQILGARRPEEEPGIWRDKELQGNEEFADVLYDKLQRVTIVLAILSPSYVASEWCQREIEAFVRAAEQHGGLTVDNKSRVFKILKTPVDRDKHPEPLRGQIGYEFYLMDKDTQIPREFTLLPGDANTALALERFNDLAHNIVKTLKGLQAIVDLRGDRVDAARTEQSKMPVEESAPHAQKASRPPIYVAETSFDLDKEHRQIRRELEAWGYTVLPQGELPLRNPVEFKSTVRDALGQCKLSIHMIGAYRSAGVAGETEDTVVLQNQIAAEQADDARVERLIWLPTGLKSDDDSQQLFIESLQKDPAAQTNAEVLQVPVQELITVTHDKLDKQQKSQKQASQTTGRQQIYVSYAREDQDAVMPLTDYLFESQFDVLEPLLDPKANDEQVLEVHKRNLTDCEAALLFSENAGEFWLKTQMSELQRASAWRGGRPIKVRAIYLGSSMIGAKGRVRTHDMVLEGGDVFAPETLAPFLAELREISGS